MNKPTFLKINIQNPCPESWSSFKHSKAGGFCKACQKTVIDFSTKTDDEIVRYLGKNKGKICGRLAPQQLKKYSIPKSTVSKRTLQNWISLGIISTLMLLNRKPVHAQKKAGFEAIQNAQDQQVTDSTLNDSRKDSFAVNGVVIDSDGNSLPGAVVLLKGTTRGASTNRNGEFKLEDVKEGDVLIFSFVGFMTEEIKVSKKNAESLKLPFRMKMCFDIMGELSVEEIYESKPSRKAGIWKSFTTWFR